MTFKICQKREKQSGIHICGLSFGHEGECECRVEPYGAAGGKCGERFVGVWDRHEQDARRTNRRRALAASAGKLQ